MLISVFAALVLDPNPFSGKALVALSQTLGCRVTWIQASRHLERLITQDERFQVVIVDSAFGDSSPDLIQAINSGRSLISDGGRALYLSDPLVVDRRYAVNSGRLETLQKPVDPKAFEAIIDAAKLRSTQVGDAQSARADRGLGAIPDAKGPE